MRPLRITRATDLVALATDAAALGLPPASYGTLPAWWSGVSGAMPELELEVWAPVAVALTGAVLYGATLHPFAPGALTIVDGQFATRASVDCGAHTQEIDTVLEVVKLGYDGNNLSFAMAPGAALARGTLGFDGSTYTYVFKAGESTVADMERAIAAELGGQIRVKTPGTAANVFLDGEGSDEMSPTPFAGGLDAELAIPGHGLQTGDGPFPSTASDGTTTPPLAWVIKLDDDVIELAASLDDALSGVPFEFVTLDQPGLASTSDTQRVYWQTHDGLLGLAGDGAIALDVQIGYRKRIPHSPRVIAYALVGTLDTGTVSAGIVPIADQG